MGKNTPTFHQGRWGQLRRMRALPEGLPGRLLQDIRGEGARVNSRRVHGVRCLLVRV